MKTLISWPAAEKVTSYRVIVHDAETKEVLHKEKVAGTEYELDWSDLNPIRLLRYRVKALDGLLWKEHVPFRTLHPPLELLPPSNAPADGASVPFTHLVLTRFSIRSSGVGYKRQWNDAWFDRRLELFEQHCLPSMLGQTSQDFTWLVFCDPVTPPGVIERLRALSDKITIADCRAYTSVRGKAPDDLRDLDKFVAPGSEVVITTRLDSDDALHRSAIELVQRHAAPFKDSVDPVLLHSFPLGCKLDIGDRRLYRTRYQQNAFLSLLERAGNNVEGVMIDSHTRLEKRCPLTRDFSILGWMQVLHGTNVSNSLNRHDEPVDGLDLLESFSQDLAAAQGARSAH
jgi:hypothetical protein